MKYVSKMKSKMKSFLLYSLMPSTQQSCEFPKKFASTDLEYCSQDF